MDYFHSLNPDAIAAELSWRRENIGYRSSIHPLPRWRTHPSSLRRTVRRTK